MSGAGDWLGMNMANGRPPVLVLIRAHLQADPKKTAVLGLLAIVMVIVYVRMFTSAERPRTAAASELVTVPASPALEADRGEGSSPNRTKARIALREPVNRQLVRDPFVVPSLYVEAESPVNREGTAGLSGQALEREVRAGAQNLVLQSTICGHRPLATINDRVLGVGDEVEGFIIEQIKPTSVTVRRAGGLVRLPLK